MTEEEIKYRDIVKELFELKLEQRRELEKSGKLQQIVKFYAPHPGLLGCPIPLSPIMVDVAKNLDGKIMKLEEGLKIIEEAAKRAGGEFEVIDDHKFISYENLKGGGMCGYRLLRYKEVEQ